MSSVELGEILSLVDSVRLKGYLDFSDKEMVFALYKKYVSLKYSHYTEGCECVSNHIKNIWNELLQFLQKNNYL